MSYGIGILSVSKSGHWAVWNQLPYVIEGADSQTMSHIKITAVYEQYHLPGGLATLNKIDGATLGWIRTVDLAL